LQTSSVGVIAAKHLGDHNIPFRGSGQLTQNIGVQAIDRVLDALLRQRGAGPLRGGMTICAGTRSSLLVMAPTAM
jgi:hypothetical protein